MSKVVLNDIGSLANQISARENINDRLDTIVAAFDNTVSRDGTTPNQMEADLDLNGNTLLNLADPVNDTDGVNLRSVQPLVEQYANQIIETFVEGTARVDIFTATSGQTIFQLTESAGVVENTIVTDSGLLMTPTVDYKLTGTNIDTITFLVGRTVGSEITVRYTLLAPADSILRSDLNTVAAGKGADLISYSSTESVADRLNSIGDLRGDLASTASGKGSELVSFTQAGTAPATRKALDKLRESVTPEDFGAVGDGTDRPVSDWLVGGARDRGYANLAAIQVDYPHVTALTESLDWAAFQQAINYCYTSGKKLRANGNYMHNRGLNITSPINLDGEAWGQSGAATGPAYTAGCRITATAAIATIIYVSPTANPGALHGVRIRNLILDGNNLAQRLLQADSCTRSTFEYLDGARCTVVGFDFTDLKGYYFYKNVINGIRYNATASVAAQASHGVYFRDTVAAAGGIVQNHIGWIETITVDGDGVVVGGADNNEFGAITNSSSGTGCGLRWKGPSGFGTLQPRNNFVRYHAGTVVDETNSRCNMIQNKSSEASSITRTGTSGETLYRVFNYITGRYWSAPDYALRDVLQFGVSKLTAITGTNGTLSALWPSIDLADAATQAFGLSTGMPYNWHNGNIKAVTLYFAMDTSAAGNVRFRIRAATPTDGVGTGAPAIDESFTVAADPTTGFLQKVTLNLTSAMSVTKGDLMLFRFERVGGDAADTHTGVMKVLGVALHYTADGPTADGGGGGPWQIIDPTI